jgi:hypothetical protein
MPRKAQRPSLSPWQAKYVLEKAIEEGKVTSADVNRYRKKMVEEATELQIRLEQLKSMMQPLRHPGEAVKSLVKKVRRAAKKVTAEVAASRKLQGQYIAAIRRLPKNHRAKFAKIAKEEGREKAIAEIKKSMQR